MSDSEEHALAKKRIGQCVADKYDLLTVLGAGGMGAVYEARHRFTERLVALKLLHPHVARVPLAAERFLREARAASAVQHEAIADVLDAGKEPDGTLYVVFERLDGEDLGTAILGGRMDAERLVEVALQVLAGLGAAHAKTIVHRDVKPGNIFVLPDVAGRVRAKLLDFGVARVMPREEDGRPLTQAGVVVGTPFYMSPEQMCGEEIDHRADLWSLCVVMFVGLAGRLPFKGTNYVALVTDMLRVGPPSLAAIRPDLPVALCEAVTRGLAPSIEARYADAEEMVEALTLARHAFSPARRSTHIVTKAPVPKRITKGATERPAWEVALEDIEHQIERIETTRPEVEAIKPKKRSRLLDALKRKK